MKLNLSRDNLTTICWLVDASHTVHDNCCGHTGAMMSRGKGATISFSNKQKINTKSSTEWELVGSNHTLSSILHTQHFIEAQGYSVKQNLLFQDNQSPMCLEVNGLFSSSKCTKHIKCRYFFIRDKIADEISKFYIILLQLCGPMFSLNPNKVDPPALTGAISYECPHQLQ
jgi:hypothetical protein